MKKKPSTKNPRVKSARANSSRNDDASASAPRKNAPHKGTSPPQDPVKLSNPDKVFWPDEGYTKRDLFEFYRAIFPKLAPWVDGRILSLERCIDGMSGPCFFQKEMPKGMPPGTPAKRVAHVGKSGKSTNYVVGGSMETQLALVNLGCIAVHVTAGRAESLRQPDWICFDLDPESGKFADAAQAGLFVKEALDELKLLSFAKTSGSRGLHVFVPLRVGPHVDEVLSFAESLAARIAAAHPTELTAEHSIAARKGRVYVDPFRNSFMQTVVTPFSVRRRPRAPVSTPLEWNEVKPSLDPASFNIENFAKRMERVDPWKDFFRSRQSLTDAIKKLKAL
jgi:bifunctional non-homologous end joining protein LigD